MKRNNRITVTLTEQNYQKMQQITETAGITKKEYINKACAAVPIIVMEQSQEIAKEFFLIRIALEKNVISEKLRKEVEKACQLLNSLTAKIVNYRS